MYSVPFVRTNVKATPVLVFRNSTRIETLEVQNPNTTQMWLQILNCASLADAKLNVTFTATAATDLITSTAHGLVNNRRIHLFTTGTLPAGLLTDTSYYVVNVTTDTFQVSLTPGGTAVDITDTGSGTHTFTTDWKQSYIIPPGDGTNYGAFSKEWPKGLQMTNGLVIAVTTTSTGSTAPGTGLLVEGTLI